MEKNPIIDSHILILGKAHSNIFVIIKAPITPKVQKRVFLIFGDNFLFKILAPFHRSKYSFRFRAARVTQPLTSNRLSHFPSNLQISLEHQ